MMKKEPKKNPVNKMKVKRSKGMKDLESDASKVKGGKGGSMRSIDAASVMTRG